MNYPMLQPQLEYGGAKYCAVTEDSPCRVIAYACEGLTALRLVPDGCEELITEWGGARGCFVRPDKTVRTELSPAADRLCGIRVEPGFTINITDGELQNILAGLVEAQSLTEARDIFLQSVMPFIGKRRVSAVWDEMAETVCASRGRSTVAELSERFGYTVRHVNNLFREGAGYGPKTFCRFVRFQNALSEMIKNPAGENSEFIERLSYADQAHFQREFKSFTGITPKRFAKIYL